MLQTVEAEIDVNGNVRLLEPVRVEKRMRALVTLLNEADERMAEEAVIKPEQNTSASTVSNETRTKRAAWLKANREQYAGLYVALDEDRLVATGKTLAEAAEKAKQSGIVKPFLVRLTSETEVMFGGW